MKISVVPCFQSEALDNDECFSIRHAVRSLNYIGDVVEVFGLRDLDGYLELVVEA